MRLYNFQEVSRSVEEYTKRLRVTLNALCVNRAERTKRRALSWGFKEGNPRCGTLQP